MFLSLFHFTRLWSPKTRWTYFSAFTANLNQAPDTGIMLVIKMLANKSHWLHSMPQCFRSPLIFKDMASTVHCLQVDLLFHPYQNPRILFVSNISREKRISSPDFHSLGSAWTLLWSTRCKHLEHFITLSYSLEFSSFPNNAKCQRVGTLILHTFYVCKVTSVMSDSFWPYVL